LTAQGPAPINRPLADALSATKTGETIETKGFFGSLGLFDIVIEGRGTWAAALLPGDERDLVSD
jgi:hypothetical protein